MAGSAARDPELTTYIAVLRDALQGLVDATHRRDEMQHTPLAPIFTTDIEVAHAENVLRMETGRHAQQELQLLTTLNTHGYVLADYAHHQLYGVPRSPSGYVPTREEVHDALTGMQATTEETWALNALLLPSTPTGD